MSRVQQNAACFGTLSHGACKYCKKWNLRSANRCINLRPKKKSTRRDTARVMNKEKYLSRNLSLDDCLESFGLHRAQNVRCRRVFRLLAVKFVAWHLSRNIKRSDGKERRATGWREKSWRQLRLKVSSHVSCPKGFRRSLRHVEQTSSS